MNIPFLKMHGLGNDFIMVDGRTQAVAVDSRLVRRLADRRTGIGFDQLVLLLPSEKASVRIRIFNADGSEVDTCGNATRCVAWMIRDEAAGKPITIETGAGVLGAAIAGDHLVTVDMGVPRLGWQEIPLAQEEDTLHVRIGEGDWRDPAAVSMGNPHLVFFVRDAAAVPVEVVGPRLETHPLFPKRTNVEFAEVKDRSHIGLRVWERGAGVTQACGSGACATLVAAVRRGLTERKASVTLPGGELLIEWQPDSDKGPGTVLMTGAVAESYRGELAAA